jgi:translation initiation factor eIF-2B subunit gamma
MVEFQAIILAGGSGIRLYPLTEDTPKSLLLANGKPLLWYQLNLLENAGFADVLVVVTMGEMFNKVDDYLKREYDGKIKVDICEVEEDTETAEALREISDKIKKDFIVLAGDLVTDAVVHNVADFHRINESTVTMVLKQEKSEKVKGGKPRREKDMIDCIGIVENEQRVVLMSQGVHLNEDMYISKSLMKRRSNFVLHTDLYDAHFYIFSHWVLDLLNEKKYIASIKSDLIPHLVRRQFRGPEALSESVRAQATSKQQLALSLSLCNNEYDPEDLLRCFAYVLPSNAYCERADTISAYEAIDKEVKSRLRISKAP